MFRIFLPNETTDQNNQFEIHRIYFDTFLLWPIISHYFYAHFMQTINMLHYIKTASICSNNLPKTCNVSTFSLNIFSCSTIESLKALTTYSLMENVPDIDLRERESATNLM